jgi:hypothetical protein
MQAGQCSSENSKTKQQTCILGDTCLISLDAIVGPTIELFTDVSNKKIACATERVRET